MDWGIQEGLYGGRGLWTTEKLDVFGGCVAKEHTKKTDGSCTRKPGMGLVLMEDGYIGRNK